MISSACPHVLVGATQLPGRTYAQPVRGKSADNLPAPLLILIQAARQRGDVTTVRADKEAGIGAIEQGLLGFGVRLSLAQGADLPC